MCLRHRHMKFNPVPSQWIGWGQLGFGSYLGVRVKAVALSLSHLTAAGLLLKAQCWSQMLNGCQVQHVILNIWNYGRTALQACSCSFSLHKTQEVSQQWKPPTLSLVNSTHSLASRTKRLETLNFLWRWVKTEFSDVNCFVNGFLFLLWINKFSTVGVFLSMAQR